jgi:NitT/TauT family transport system permease protein
MRMNSIALTPPVRDEYELTVLPAKDPADVEVRLPLFARLAEMTLMRRLAFLIILAGIWEVYARWINIPILFPSFSETMRALGEGIASGVIPARLFITLKTLMVGYLIGLLVASAFTILAVSTRIGTDILSTLTAMFNPMPAIALLPLALLWFGLGSVSLFFVIVHSVVWAVALNAQSGFLGVSETLRMAGQTFGLRGVKLVFHILIPAALPSIVTGLKIGWAFAWRTLIAAELVFGAASGQGGLGWFIFESRNSLITPSVFAGLLTVMVVGLIIENGIFRQIEKRTVIRWGQVRA